MFVFQTRYPRVSIFKQTIISENMKWELHVRISIEWSRLMRLEPPGLENVKVKPKIKPESVDDCMADAETSPTLKLDF